MVLNKWSVSCFCLLLFWWGGIYLFLCVCFKGGGGVLHVYSKSECWPFTGIVITKHLIMVGGFQWRVQKLHGGAIIRYRRPSTSSNGALERLRILFANFSGRPHLHPPLVFIFVEKHTHTQTAQLQLTTH